MRQPPFLISLERIRLPAQRDITLSLLLGLVPKVVIYASGNPVWRSPIRKNKGVQADIQFSGKQRDGFKLWAAAAQLGVHDRAVAHPHLCRQPLLRLFGGLALLPEHFAERIHRIVHCNSPLIHCNVYHHRYKSPFTAPLVHHN